MEAKCKFHTDYGMTPSYPFVPYKCTVKEITGVSGEQEMEIESFTGDHEEEKSNNDVTWLIFYEQKIKRIPRSLHKIFPNLRHLLITQCDIEGFTREDLKGLENLEYLRVHGYYHKISSLPDDLFADMKKLREVSFFAHSLERLSSRILLPIKSTLEFANFYNQRTNNQQCFNNRKDLKKYMKFLDSNFSPEPEADKTESSEAASYEADTETNEGDDDEWTEEEDEDSTESENERIILKARRSRAGKVTSMFQPDKTVNEEPVKKSFSEFFGLNRPSVEASMFQANKPANEETAAKKPQTSSSLQLDSQAEKLSAGIFNFKFN